jgi:hypothetical protein
MQQGRVQLDSDWNEQVERERQLTRQAVRDAIGHCGVPRDLPGFAVQPGAAGGFTLGAGRLYADGMLIELDDDVAAGAQPFGGETIAAVTNGQRALVSLECSERLQTALDDDRQRETALGGPDTMVRVQTVWRTRVDAIDDLPVTEQEVLDAIVERRPLGLPGWAPSTGRLEASSSVAQVDADGRPCLLPPTAGYTDQLNSLYRVEIHASGDENSARYKWSRRNASVRGVLDVAGGRMTLVGVEANEAIVTGDWVEVHRPVDLPAGTTGSLTRITIAPDQSVTFDANLPPGHAVGGAVVTLWDQPAASPPTGIPLHTAAAPLEAGVEVQFTAGSYAAGEYWLIPARAATGDIEWPPVADGPAAVRPFNRTLAYCPLALVTRQGVTIANDVEDLRVEFPPLTAIRASDVSYDSTVVDIDGAVDVQEALERLANRGTGSCTFHAAPGPGWEAVFDEVDTGGNAEICLEVGEYVLNDVLSVVGRGHLTVSGRGRGTHIVAPNWESAIQFVRCAGVTVRDLRISAGTSRRARRLPGRNGALEFRDCGYVVVDGVHARVRGVEPRSTACVSVTRSFDRRTSRHAGRGDVVVRNSTLEAGLQQIGLQVINPRRAVISDNTVLAQPMQANQVWRVFESTRSLRRDVADLLVAHRRPERADAHPSVDDLQRSQLWDERTFVLDEHQVVAVALPEVADSIVAYLAEAGPAGIRSDGELSTHIRNRLMDALAHDGVVSVTSRDRRRAVRTFGFDLLGGWLKNVRNQVQVHLSQGIVVAGRTAQLVEIHRNEVSDAIQGIHVGLSHRDQQPGDRDVAGRVSIVGNTVTTSSVPVSRARHGVFCGNAQSLLVHDNAIRRGSTSPSLSRIPLNGVHIHGFSGPFMQVKNNDVRNCTTGVRFVPDASKRSTPLWLIEDNLFMSAAHPVDVPPHLVPSDVAALVRRSENNVTG